VHPEANVTGRLLLLMLLPLLGACSASTLDYTPCSSNTECRDAFGYGAVCSDGLCGTAELDPRCNLGPDDGHALPLSTDDVVLLGTLFDRSTESHLARERAATLALDQANTSSDLAGRSFVVARCTNEEGDLDALSRDEATVAMALHLADDLGVPAMVGPSASSRTQSAFDAVEGLGTLVLSPSATSPALTAADGQEHSEADPGLLWRTAPPDTVQGPVIAQSMIDRGVVTVAAIHRADAYGEGLVEVVAESFTGADRTVTLLPYDTEAGLVDQTVNAVAGGDVDEVLFVSSTLDEVVAFLDAAATVPGFDGVGIFLTDSARSQDLLDRAEDAIDDLGDIHGTSPALPTGSVYDAFRAGYAVAYDEDPDGRSFSAHAYDGMWLVAYGAAWAHFQEPSISGLHIARGLRRVSDGEVIELRSSEWVPALTAFEAAESIDVVGASGELDFDPVTGETSGPIELWRIADDGDSFEVLSR